MVEVEKDFDLSDFRCVRCDSSTLKCNPSSDLTRNQIVSGFVQCENCGAAFDAIWGVIFFGDFEQQDILGLIEIAATMGTHDQVKRQEFEELEDLLSGYHYAKDREAFIRDSTNKMAKSNWFPWRYNEWKEFMLLTEDVDFKGLNVLNVGAGLGFDSFRLVKSGACVTALDFNPLHTRQGRQELPEARWVGGFSHVMPFATGSFDVVCCNAGLHHMRDTSGSVEEMLRVAKPDGLLITTGDPYRADHLSVEHELKVFDTHHGVLGGVNECIPALGSILDPIEKKGNGTTTKLMTGRGTKKDRNIQRWMRALKRIMPIFKKNVNVQSNNTPCDKYNFEGFNLWELSRHRQQLGKKCGTVAVRVDLNHPEVQKAPIQRKGIITPAAYMQHLDSEATALAQLTQMLDREHVDIPFPFPTQTKFNLLNGWRAYDKRNDFQPAYKRARWFLTRQKGQIFLSFEVRLLRENPKSEGTIAVLLNAHLVIKASVSAVRWQRVDVPLNLVPEGAVYCCELHLWPDGKPVKETLRLTLDKKLAFCIRRRMISDKSITNPN